MVQLSGEGASGERARWLAELSEALDAARHLMKSLGAAEGRLDAIELYTRIETLRFEVQALQLRRLGPSGEQSGPNRIDSFPWERRTRSDF